jgi:hypothetical protein
MKCPIILQIWDKSIFTTNQPINQSTNQSTNQPINQSTNQSTNQPINQSTNQSTNQPYLEFYQF